MPNGGDGSGQGVVLGKGTNTHEALAAWPALSKPFTGRGVARSPVLSYKAKLLVTIF